LLDDLSWGKRIKAAVEWGMAEFLPCY